MCKVADYSYQWQAPKISGSCCAWRRPTLSERHVGSVTKVLRPSLERKSNIYVLRHCLRLISKLKGTYNGTGEIKYALGGAYIGEVSILETIQYVAFI